jgi:anti-anti-sigma factor
VNDEAAEFQVHRRDGVAVVSVSGELDAACTEGFDIACEEALSSGLPVVIDLEACDFIDSQGISGIIQTSHLASGAGRGFALAGSGPQVKRVLELSGMSRLLPYFENLEDAVNHAG